MRTFVDVATFLLTGAPYSRWSDEAGMEYVFLLFGFVALGLLAYFVFALA
jgi:hypothetical protein